jgi:glycosyltransferase involved in cell wall biosynthesis
VNLVSEAHDVRPLLESNADLRADFGTAAQMVYSHSKKRDVGTTIDRFSPDVIHIHNTYPSLGPAILLAANERHIPVVATVHNFRMRCPNGLMFTEGASCRRCQAGVYVHATLHDCFPTRKQATAYAVALWTHRFLLHLERRITRFVVPSEFMRARLIEWGIDEHRLKVIRHFIPDHAQLALEPKLGGYGAYSGRLSPEKGLDALLASLRRAGDPPFWIIGDGPHRRLLEQVAIRLGLKNTRFLGWRPRDEALLVLAGARFVAVPSLAEESASLTALEALAAGRPLLVSDRGALPELVARGAGLICRAGDETTLSENITRLMDDDAFCRRASAVALQTARDMLSPQHHLADLESLYMAVV